MPFNQEIKNEKGEDKFEIFTSVLSHGDDKEIVEVKLIKETEEENDDIETQEVDIRFFLFYKRIIIANLK